MKRRDITDRFKDRRFVAFFVTGTALPVCLTLLPRALSAVVIVLWLFAFGVFIQYMLETLDALSVLKMHYRTVSNSLDGFVEAGDVDGVYAAGLEAATTLLKPVDHEAMTSIVAMRNKQWTIVATTSPTRVNLRGQSRIDLVVQSVLGKNDEDQSTIREPRQLRIFDRYILVLPLVSRGRFLGSLVVDSSKRLPNTTTEALTALSGELTLAQDLDACLQETERFRSDGRYRALVQTSADAVFVIKLDGSIGFHNFAGEKLLEAAGQTSNLYQAVHPEDRQAFTSMIKYAPQVAGSLSERRSVECRCVSSNGPTRWVSATSLDMTRSADIQGYVVTMHDITERMIVENDLRHGVMHDELTGIPNRAMLRERADMALTLRRSDNTFAALLFIGLGHINIPLDVSKKEAHDDILRIIAFRLENYVRGHDTTARIGNETFAVLLQDVAAETDVTKVAKRLLDVIERPIDFDGRNVDIEAKIGVCIAQPEYDSGIFLRNADVALHEATQSRSESIVQFSNSMSIDSSEREILERDLEFAIERNELVTFYQPLTHLSTSTLAGFEALIRWTHPELGMVSPASFIPIAEETGLIVDIGDWIMYQACLQVAAWRASRPDLKLRVHVNVAPQQLERSTVAATVRGIIEDAGIAPEALVLELTSSRQVDVPHVRNRLAQLRDLGVGIAIDDFGGRFNSLSALEELPVSIIKVDRSLILGLDVNFQKASSEIRKTVEVAHALNMEVIAEGIEDSRQRDLLVATGCDCGQGYFFGRPVAAHEAEQVVDEVQTVDPF